MIDIALHTGSTHPDLWWIGVPALLAFLLGTGISLFADRVRSAIGFRTDTTE